MRKNPGVATETARHPSSPAEVPMARTVPFGALLVLFFVSGAAALIYEVLWLKELGRLFGVTAYAAATTLAVFFLGLALGGLVWGRRAERVVDPLKTYAVLELGIAASALLYFVLLDAYRAVQSPLFGAIGYQPALLLAVKIGLATGILLLPAFLMGGTLPVMAQFLVRQRTQLGSRATLLYAVNTIGAAVGALSAGFLLPRVLGFRGSYLVAIVLNLTIASITWSWRGRVAPGPRGDGSGEPEVRSPRPDATRDISAGLIAVVAAVSGLTTLALEVVWTRMYAQVLQNSVYTFSIILTVFLAGLAGGSALAHLLCRRVRSTRFTLALLLTLSGLLVALSPLLFQQLAGALDYMHSGLGFGSYIALVFAGTAVVIGPAVVCMGAVFPFLMKLSERHLRSAGRTVGQLAAINTASAIAGSLLAGFVLLQMLGVWGSIRAAVIVYLLVALAVWPWRARNRRAWVALPLVGLAVCGGLLDYGDYSRIWLDLEAGEELVEGWEGPAGAVAVTRHGDGGLRIRVNSSYSLGTSASAPNERLQGQLPLLLHPDPKSVFFLGLGTGITASSAMQFPVERVVVCEVNADVLRASRTHFKPWLLGLFDDPRVVVLPEDGRTWLAATRDHFDVVIADIFLSFKVGVGSLYTVEHFRSVRERLAPGGMLVQWLPMFDMSVPEFDMVARTMLEVFPSVTLWRRSLSPTFPVYALIGQLENDGLDLAVMRDGLERLQTTASLDPRNWLLNIPLASYAGNVSAMRERFAAAAVNTDDRTLLEYVAPITERNSRGAGTTEVLAWSTLLRFCETMIEALPPERDPYLAGVDPATRGQVRAGLAYYGYTVHQRRGEDATARAYMAEYQRWLGQP